MSATKRFGEQQATSEFRPQGKLRLRMFKELGQGVVWEVTLEPPSAGDWRPPGQESIGEALARFKSEHADLIVIAFGPDLTPWDGVTEPQPPRYVVVTEPRVVS